MRSSVSCSMPIAALAMPLPETDIARVRRWTDARNSALPPRAVGQLRFELDVDERAATILECRPPWREGFASEWTRFPVARLRYTKDRREWQIYWTDRQATVVNNRC